MNYQTEADKKERRKIIVISTIAIILILVLIVVILGITIKKQPNTLHDQTGEAFELNEENNNTKENTDNKTEKNSNPTKDNEKPNNSSSLSQITTKTIVDTPIISTPTTSTAIPVTGPEDIFPIALISGSLVAFLTSLYLAKH